MKWLEVIHIRTGGNSTQKLVSGLTQMLTDLERETNTPQISLFRHSALPSEFSVHIHHQDGPLPLEKSSTGLRLVSFLRELGMINHTIWALEKESP